MGQQARRMLAVAVAVLVAVIGGVLAIDAAAADAATYHSPGYGGTTKPVATQAAPTIPPVVLGSGVDPTIVVDAAGTAHIAWSTDDGAQADALHYCRLPRGATACATTATLRPEPTSPSSDYDPAYNIESGGPQLFVLGSQLVMVSHRISTSGFSHPDGSTGATTLVYVSQDGGSSWSPVNGVPQYGIVGTAEIGGPGITYGTDTDPKIGVINTLDTDGTSFQELSPGAFTSQSALIGPGLSEGSAGSLVLDGEDPLAAFHGPTNNSIDLRRFSGNGSPNDVANWGSIFQLPGSDPQLTSGPSGIFLLDSELKYSAFSVHRLSVAGSGADPAITEGPGTRITEDNANDASLSEAPDGSVYAAWSGPAGLRLNSTRNGATWASAQGTTIYPSTKDLTDTHLAVAGDGGGFAVVRQDTGATEGPIMAVPFGTQTATGQTGLGDLPGGQGDAGVSEGCETVTFGPVKAQVQAGCFLKGAKGAQDDEVSDGTITVNGVSITPDAGASTALRSGHSTAGPTQIIVNAHTGTIDSTGPVTVAMANATPAIVLWHGAIHLDLHGAKVGDTLFDFPPQGHEIDGFAVRGDILVRIAAGYGVAVPVAANLPDWASGYTAGATLTGNSKGGLNQGSLELRIPDMPLGALELKDVDIRYDPLADSWSGSAELDVPEGGDAFTAKLDITFQHGQLTHAAFATDIPAPGIPVYTDIYVHEFQGSFDADPFTLSIGGRVGLYLPTGLTDFPIDVLGTLTAKFGPPDVFALDGELDVFGVSIGTAEAKIAFDPFSFHTSADLDLLGLIQGSASIDIDPPNFSGSGSVDVAGFDVGAYVSNKAIAGCIAKFHFHAGLLYYWGGSIDLLVGPGGIKSCDLPANVQSHIRASHVVSGGGRLLTDTSSGTFTVAAGTLYEDVNVRTAAGSPSVTLTSPSGSTVTPVPLTSSGAAPPVGAPVILVDGTQAVVMLPHPAAGIWSVQATDGAPAITSLDAARGLTPPVLHARLVHRGRRLVISYSLTRRSGVSVSFIEHGRGVDRVVKTVPGGTGSISLTPAPGPGGRRSIAALIQDSGEPLTRPLIGTFTAPAPARVATPRLKLAVRGRSFRISLLSSVSAQRVLVRATFSDGRTLAYTFAGGAHTLTIPALGYSDTVRVTATATSANGPASRPVRASARYPAPPRRRR